MGIKKKAKDKLKRHNERHAALSHQCVLSDSIAFINHEAWDAIANQSSIFLSRDYLNVIEANSPENTTQKYAIAYDNGKPVVILACQIAEISGEQLVGQDSIHQNPIAKGYKERVLVCGNLVSSGLHGVAFAEGFDAETGWRIVTEILYKIRRADKLNGDIDFVLIKDIKGKQLEASKVVERFSYRSIQTDPDMVLNLGNEIQSFDDYLAMLTSKYRSRIKKIIKKIDTAGFETTKININEDTDKQLHKLYLAVENKSATRLATLPVGYYSALSKSLKDNFVCFVIKKEQQIAGFVTVIKDKNNAVAYYVGIDYEVNANHPIYFRLLQLVIQGAIDMGCNRVLFGRTALEPKATLGAKPVDTFVWARHRVPLVNFVIRKLFRNISFDIAPERKATKQ